MLATNRIHTQLETTVHDTDGGYSDGVFASPMGWITPPAVGSMYFCALGQDIAYCFLVNSTHDEFAWSTVSYNRYHPPIFEARLACSTATATMTCSHELVGWAFEASWDHAR